MIVRSVQTALRDIAVEKSLKPNRVAAWNAGGCGAALWYTARGFPKAASPDSSLLRNRMGNWIEDGLHDLLEGTVEGYRRAKWPQDCGELPPLPGRYIGDGFLANYKGARWVVECKTYAMRKEFDELVETGVIPEKNRDQHTCQALTYAKGYDTPGTLYVAFLIDPFDMRLTEIEIPRDDEKWESYMEPVRAILDDNEPCPERPYELEDKCSGCDGGKKRCATSVCDGGLTLKARKPHKSCDGSGYYPHETCNGTGKIEGGPFLPKYPCGGCGFRFSCWPPAGGTLVEVQQAKGKPRLRPEGPKR